MARKNPAAAGKAAPPKGAKAASPAAPPRKKNLLVIKGFEDWGEWVEGLAAHKRMPVTVLIDHLLTEEAKRVGYPAPPPRY